MDDEGEVGVLRQERGEGVGRIVQESLIKAIAAVVGVEGQVGDLGLDQIREKMRAEGDLGDVAVALAGHFDEHPGLADVGVSDGHAEADVVAAPATGADEDEVAAGEALVEAADDAAHGAPLLAAGDAVVVARVDIDDELDVLDETGADKFLGAEDGALLGDVRGD